MDGVITLVLLGLLTALVGDAAASCRQIPNDDMLEYSCEGGHPADLASVPESTEKLRIVRMPLRRITADTFSRFNGNLLVLSCSHCEIADIDADAFRRLVNLQQLSLDNGHLSTVKATWFEDLSQLTFLDLTYNDIRDIEDDVYKHLPHLVDFRISGNKLQCLNLEAMSHLSTLKRIFLSENPDFACPHAVSRFLENQGVSFEPDPEWRRLASDTIDVPVPPSRADVDRQPVPPYPNRRPPEAPGVPAGDRRLYPDYAEYHRSRHRKPTRPTTQAVPRVEPVESIRAESPLEVPSNQLLPYPYSPHTTHETLATSLQPRYPEAPPEPSSHRVISYPYSPHTTHETTPSTSYPRYPEAPSESSSHHWTPYPHSTAETSRVPFAESRPSEDIRIAGSDRSSQAPSYPPYATHGTVYPSSYPTTERSRLLEVAREDDTTADYETPSRPENVVTYPLHALTSTERKGEEGRSEDGYVQITGLPYNVRGNAITSTEDVIDVEHAEISSRMRDGGRQEYPPRPTDGNERSRQSWSTNTPYETPHHVGQDSSRKSIVDETSANDHTNPAERVKPDQSPTTATASTVHYVRPSPPELMHSPATTGDGDAFYQAPYYEATATVHPPWRNYPDTASTVYIYPTQVTTTDKPLPECNENSAPSAQPAAVLVMSIIITIFGRVIVEGF